MKPTNKVRLVLILALAIAALLTVLNSCKPVRSIQTHDTLITHYNDSTRIRDSVRVKDSIHIKVKDSIILIPRTVISGQVSTPCDSLGKLRSFNYFLGAGINRVHIWTDGGIIHFESTVDSLMNEFKVQEFYEAKWRDSVSAVYQRQDSLRSSTKSTQLTITKPLHSAFVQILIYLGISLSSLILGFILGKLLKVKIGVFGF